MIDHYTIKLAPALNQKEVMKKLEEGKQLIPDDLAKLSKVKAKLLRGESTRDPVCTLRSQLRIGTCLLAFSL